jgi:hypothetical protein
MARVDKPSVLIAGGVELSCNDGHSLNMIHFVPAVHVDKASGLAIGVRRYRGTRATIN